MKTTYVLNYKDLDQLKLRVLPPKKIIWYFLARNKLIEWLPETNKFKEINGLIDIAITKEIIMEPDNAKKICNRKNVIFLVKRMQLNEYFWNEINKVGILYHVVAEDVPNQLKLIDEYHIVFDEKIDTTPPFKCKTVFYGNIYDYLELKRTEELSNE